MNIRRNAVSDTPLHIHQSSSRMERIQDKARVYIIRFNNEKCVLFFPCLHVGVCVVFSDKLEKKTNVLLVSMKSERN